MYLCNIKFNKKIVIGIDNMFIRLCYSCLLAHIIGKEIIILMTTLLLLMFILAYGIVLLYLLLC